MFCAIFFIKIARSYLFTSALCFPLFLSLLPSIFAFASFYSCLCFLLSSLLLPSLFLSLLQSILAPSQICFSTPQIYQSPFFFPRLFPAATHPFRHETVYREQLSCHLAVFRAATHLFPLKSLYREQVWCGL